MAGQRRRTIPAPARSAPSPSRSEFQRGGTHPNRHKRQLSFCDDQARRLSLVESLQCMAASSYSFFSVWTRISEPADYANVFSRRSIVRVRPNLSIRARTGTGSYGFEIGYGNDAAGMGSGISLRYRSAWARGYAFRVIRNGTRTHTIADRWTVFTYRDDGSALCHPNGRARHNGCAYSVEMPRPGCGQCPSQ